MKSIAVRDACKAVSNAKIFNTGLKKDQAAGIRLDETFAEPGFRSRKDPRQNSFIPAKAVFPEGPYPKLLGTLKMAEGNAGDSPGFQADPSQRQLLPLNPHPGQLRC